MCSFGYVIFDENFNIIEKEDIIINPEASFDKRFYKKNSEINLPYSEPYYKSFNNFRVNYEKIKAIVERRYEIIIGFGIINDLKYLHDNTSRYKIEHLKVSGIDVRDILIYYDDYRGSLANAEIEYLANNNLELENHSSVDDALKTMLLLKKISEREKKSIKNIIEEVKPKEYDYSKKEYSVSRKSNRKKARKQMDQYFNFKNDEPTTEMLNNKSFTISMLVQEENEILENVIKYIFNNGGILVKSLSDSNYIVTLGEKDNERLLNMIDLSKVETITYKDLIK